MKTKILKNSLLILGASAFSLLPVSCFHDYPVRPVTKPVDPNDPGAKKPEDPEKDKKPTDPKEGAPVEEPPKGLGPNPFAPKPTTDPTTPPEVNTPEYQNATFLNRYYADEAAYMNSLVKSLWPGGTSEADSEIYETFDKTHVQNFNTKASELHLPAFLDSYAKNFTVTDNNNNVVLNPLGQFRRRKYWADAEFDRGTARYIPNDLYKQVLGESYSIIISNNNKYLEELGDRQLPPGRLAQGTAWILDYATNEDNLITKLYLATNLHVASDLLTEKDNGSVFTNILPDEVMRQNADRVIKANEKIKELTPETARLEKEVEDAKLKYGIESPQYKEVNAKFEAALVPYAEAQKAFKEATNNIVGVTRNVTLAHFNPGTPTEVELKRTNQDTRVDFFNFDPKNIRIVYAGANFLSTSPSAYLDPSSPYAKLEEMADFAVIEITMDQKQQKYTYTSPNDDSGTNENSIDAYKDYVLYLTSAYQNKEKQSKPANFDLLTNYDELVSEKITVNNKEVSKMDYDLLALGFPNAKSDHDLIASLSNKDEIPSLSSTSSVWVNKSKVNKDNALGGGLSQNLALRTFIDKPGLTDIFLSNPIINAMDKKGFEVKYLKEKGSNYTGNSYINYGLGYILHNWQPGEGASGSSVRDIDGNILGITFAAADGNFSTLVSLSQALRSPGYDYQGQYGKYNLEQYDLIYGGGKNQRTSYRQALQRIYGDNYKTKLFPEGVSKIPEDYKFKNK
ncbi:Ig-specific serine endopeptidase MIP [Mycoplasma sp. Sp33II]|uniref:Ig-specific serine endopeptidase MIP n=1 Tax=unclassified Mycoplasma TaxID=2683645 RepID=UPI003AABF948